MNNNARILLELREKAKLTQAELAERLGFTQKQLSMLEAGETELTTKEAIRIASKIGTEDGKAFADYLGQDWIITEKPSFRYPYRKHLWKVESSLQEIQKMARLSLSESLKQEKVALEKKFRRAGEELRLKHPDLEPPLRN